MKYSSVRCIKILPILLLVSSCATNPCPDRKPDSVVALSKIEGSIPIYNIVAGTVARRRALKKCTDLGMKTIYFSTKIDSLFGGNTYLAWCGEDQSNTRLKLCSASSVGSGRIHQWRKEYLQDKKV